MLVIFKLLLPPPFIVKIANKELKVLAESAHFPQSVLRDDIRATVIAAELAFDMTDGGIADEIDSCAASVGNWRNRNNDMSLHTWLKGGRRFGALWFNRCLERHGFRVVPMENATTELCEKSLGMALGKLDYEMRVALDDGSSSDRELLSIAPTIDDVGPMFDALRERLRDLRERRS